MKRCLVVLFLVLAGCENEYVPLDDAGCETELCRASECSTRCRVRSETYFTGACLPGPVSWLPCACCACATSWEGIIVLDDVFGECAACGVVP